MMTKCKRFRPSLEALEDRLVPDATLFIWYGADGNSNWNDAANWILGTGGVASRAPGTDGSNTDQVLFDSHASLDCKSLSTDPHYNVGELDSSTQFDHQLIVQGQLQVHGTYYDSNYTQHTNSQSYWRAGGIVLDGTNSEGSLYLTDSCKFHWLGGGFEDENGGAEATLPMGIIVQKGSIVYASPTGNDPSTGDMGVPLMLGNGVYTAWPESYFIYEGAAQNLKTLDSDPIDVVHGGSLEFRAAGNETAHGLSSVGGDCTITIGEGGQMICHGGSYTFAANIDDNYGEVMDQTGTTMTVLGTTTVDGGELNIGDGAFYADDVTVQDGGQLSVGTEYTDPISGLVDDDNGAAATVRGTVTITSGYVNLVVGKPAVDWSGAGVFNTLSVTQNLTLQSGPLIIDVNVANNGGCDSVMVGGTMTAGQNTLVYVYVHNDNGAQNGRWTFLSATTMASAFSAFDGVGSVNLLTLHNNQNGQYFTD
jgi:hypothetical protein